jgi:hypothetical protein
MDTHDGQKLLSAFENAFSKDKATMARIKVANEKSSPIVSIFYILISRSLMVGHQPTAGPRKKVHFVILRSWCWDPPPTVIKG